MSASGLSRGDRAVFLGLGQLRGKHADVVSARREFVVLAFDDVPRGTLTLAANVHAIPRRPKPDFD